MTLRRRLSPLFTRRRIGSVLLALAGAVAFELLGLPLPFLFGPMAAGLAAALAGARLEASDTASALSRAVLGVAVGASITPEVVGRIPQMTASLALVPVYIALIGVTGVPFFRWLGFDRATAYFAAMPGGLQDMVSFGQEAGGNVRALSLIHATRVLVLVTLAPMILTGAYGVELTHPVGRPAADIPVVELALMAAAAVLGWKGAERVGLFGASILGPMLVTMVLSLTGLIHVRPPKEAILAAQLFLGLGIGVHYVGVTLRELRDTVLKGMAFVVLLAVLAALFTEIVVLTGLARPVEGFLSFTPGGQAEMTLLAIVVGADLGYVVAHHLARMVLVIAGAPVAARLMGLRRRE